MKYTCISFVALAFQLFSCSAPAEDTQHPADTTQTSDTACFIYAGREDEVFMQLVPAGEGRFRGMLQYDLNYKDRNDGTLEGSLDGDKLVAEYTFRSEGLTSVRQVVFRKEGDTWVEGYGETVEAAGKQTFKDINALKYNTAIRLKPVSCR